MGQSSGSGHDAPSSKANMHRNSMNASTILLSTSGAAPLQRGKTPLTNVLDMTLKNLLGLWKMRRTPLLPSLPGPRWPGVVVSDRVLYIGQIELNCVLMLNWIV